MKPAQIAGLADQRSHGLNLKCKLSIIRPSADALGIASTYTEPAGLCSWETNNGEGLTVLPRINVCTILVASRRAKA